MPGETTEAGIEAKKQFYEQRLWARAEELALKRQELQTLADELYELINFGKDSGFGLQAVENISHKQGVYFQLLEQIGAIKELEKQVEAALLALEEGKIDEKKLDGLIKQD